MIYFVTVVVWGSFNAQQDALDELALRAKVLVRYLLFQPGEPQLNDIQVRRVGGKKQYVVIF